MSGMDLPLAVMITIPAPWEHDRYMRQEIKDFYRYYATMMEPRDGPTSILFTDGEILGAEKYAAEGFGLELDGCLRVKTKNDGHRTQVPGIYTAGDMRRGQFLVVWAIREGRNAAREVDEDLMGYSNLGAAE